MISTEAPEEEFERIGYIQISNLQNKNCVPEEGTYNGYLTYDTLYGEELKEGKYCESGKGEECDSLKSNFIDYSSCYGLKIYSSRYSITDVFSVNYTLCGGEK